MNDEELDAFLEHHGVKGMHWGIRNEKDKQLHREKKAKIFEAKAEKHQRSIDALKKAKPNPFHTQESIDAQIAAFSELKQRQLKSAKATRQGKFRFTDTQKQVISVGIGTAFIAAYLASAARGGQSARNIGSNTKTPRSAKDFINQERATQMYSLNRMHQEGKMDAEQFAKFSKILNDRFDRKVAAL